MLPEMNESRGTPFWSALAKVGVLLALGVSLQTAVPVGLQSPYLDRINMLVTRGSFASARDLVTAVRRRSPADPLSLTHDITQRVNEHSYESVVKELEVIARRDPSREAHFAKALLLGSGPEKSRLLAKILEGDPSFSAAQELYVAERAYRLNQHGQLENAVVLARQACPAGCVTSQAPLQLASLLLQMGRREEALRQIEIGLHVNPFDPMGYLMQAAFHLETGQVARALAVVERALTVAPQAIVLHYMKAEALRASGEELEALKSYESAVRLAPGRAEDYVFRGSAFLALERTQEAIRDFEEAFQRMPEDLGTKVLLADAYATSGDRAGALRLWNETVAQNGRHVPALLSLAAHFLDRREFTRSRLLAERVLRIQPGQLDARWLKASSLLGERNLTEAIPLLERLRKEAGTHNGVLVEEVKKKLDLAYEIRWLEVRRQEALAQWRAMPWETWKDAWLSPRFGTHETPHFLVVSDLGPYYRERYGRILEVFHDSLVRDFGLPAIERRVPYVIFAREDGYAQFLERLGDERVQGALYLEDLDLFCGLRYYSNGRYRSIGGLLEVVAQRFLAGQAPWVRQGFSGFFETASVVQGKLVFGSVSSERAQILKDALARVAAGERLIAPLFAFRGDDLFERPGYFERARAIFELADRQGVLAQVLARVREGEPAERALTRSLKLPRRRLEVLYRKFLEAEVLPAAGIEEAYEALGRDDRETAEERFGEALRALPTWGAGHYDRAVYFLETQQPLSVLEETRDALADPRFPYPAQATGKAAYALWDLGAKELALTLLASVLAYEDYDVNLESYIYYLARYLEQSGRNEEALRMYRKYLTLIEANDQLETFRGAVEKAIQTLERGSPQAA